MKGYSTIGGYLDHFPFSKGLSDWVNRHNFYSTQEAQQTLANRIQGEKLNPFAIPFEKDSKERRRKVKELYYRLPARPLVKFITMYIFKLGFLDGAAGLCYSALIAFYELLIVLKTAELEQAPQPRI